MLLMVIVKSGQISVIAPHLSFTHAAHTGIEDIRCWSDGEDPGVLFEQIAIEKGLKTAVIGVDDEMPAAHLIRLQQALPAALFKAAGFVMAEVRKCKEPEELEKMRRAAHIADAAYHDSLVAIKPGKTEIDIQRVLISGMSDRGGVPTFCIVATGHNGAEPHHSTSATQLKEGELVVMDWGCSVEGYLSDITRTVCLGKASSDARKVYSIVRDAHMAAREAIRPGVPCQDLDKAARKVIVDAGFGDYFIHRTGHGIGLMGHEPPYIVEGSESPLELGQCFSIEPGIYIPGQFGVRIENIVTVTEDGHESLNEEPPVNLVEIGGSA